MNQSARVLVAAADKARGTALAGLLEKAGLSAFGSADGAPALGAAREQDPELVLLQTSGGGEELELVRQLRAARGEQKVLPVVCLVCGGPEARLAALRAGADDAVLAGPGDGEELVERIGRVLGARQRERALAEHAEELTRLAVTDALTGLYNRRLFEERLREEFVRAQRFGDPLGLLMIDLDHFKQVNDRHGHLVGDQVLRGTAEALRGSVREIDLVTRFGGEEFTVILPRTALPGVLVVAERIWRAIGKVRFNAAGSPVRVTASVGVASYPSRDVRGPADLVETADRALYRAKRAGRDRIGLPPCSRAADSAPRASGAWLQADQQASN